VHLAFVQPMTVIHDRPDEVALLRRPGHVWKKRRAVLDGPRPEAGHTVVAWRDGFADDVWRHWRVVVLKPPQAEHAVSLFWHEAEDRPDFWYIDLTSPLRRSAIGFDFVENGLDIVVEPDLSSWRWKDEDEMEWAVERGHYLREELAALRAEGERAVERLVRERTRFESWLDWRPDPAWPLATLPTGWDAGVGR
jgi:hypothetical protein